MHPHGSYDTSRTSYDFSTCFRDETGGCESGKDVMLMGKAYLNATQDPETDGSALAMIAAKYSKNYNSTSTHTAILTTTYRFAFDRFFAYRFCKHFKNNRALIVRFVKHGEDYIGL